MFDYKKILAGAVIGFLGAAIADIDAWRDGLQEAEGEKFWPPFDWAKAIRRWVAGAVTGATGALGLGA